MERRARASGDRTDSGIRRSYAWSVPIWFAFLGVLWIFIMDHLIGSVVLRGGLPPKLEIIEDWVFVGIMTLLLVASLRIAARNEARRTREVEESEEKFRTLFEQSRHGIIIIDAADGGIVDCNPAYEEMTKRSKKELEGMKVWELRPLELQDKSKALFEEILDKGFGAGNAVDILRPNGTRIGVNHEGVVVSIQGRKHVLRILRDVTEQRKAERALRESEEKFRTVAEQILLGIAIIQDDGIKYVNAAFCAICGVESMEVVNRTLSEASDLIHVEDRERVLDIAKRRLAGDDNVPDTYEYRTTVKPGEVKWLRAYSRLMTYEGKPATLQMVVDITAQKQAEEALKAEKERAQMHLSLTPVMFVALDSGGRITLANKKATEIMSCTEEDLVGKDWFEHFIPPKNRERVRGVFEQLITGEIEPAEFFENPVLTSEGEEKLIEWRNTVFRDEAGRPTGVLSAGVDITERRAMERALRESEGRFRSLFGTMTEGVAIHEATRNGAGDITDFVIKDVNPAFEQLIGRKRQQLVGVKASEVYGAELRSHYRECAKVAETGWPTRFEGRMKEPERYFDVKCFAPRKDWFAAVIDDVTEVRKAQIALWEEKDLVSRIMETSPAGITLVNRQGQLTYANPAAEKVLGLSASKIVERTYNDPEWKITDYEGRPFPDDQQPFTRVMTSGQPVTGVRHAIEWPTGRRALLAINASPLRSVAGEIEGMVAIVEDVTNRVKAQQALRASEERLQSILRTSPIGIGLTKNREFVWTNEFFQKVLGYSASELEGQSVRMIYETEEEFARVGEVLFAEIDAWGMGVMETQWRCKDGSVIDALLSASYLNVDTGERGTQFAALDITDRKAAERALRESERAMSTLVSNLPGVVYRCRIDRDWTMEFISDGITALSGYEPADLIENQRLSYNDLIHPDDRGRIWNEVSRALESNEPFELEYRIVSKDGGVKQVWEQGCPVLDANGKIETLEGYILDVTDRKRAEEELRATAEKLQGVLSSIPDGLDVVGPDHRITYQNELLRARFGDQVEKLCHEAYMGVKVPCDGCPMEEALKTGKTARAEMTGVDGRDYELTSTPFTDVDGVVRAIEVVRDITDRKRAEEALRESEEKFRLLAENSRDLIYRYRLKPQRGFEYVSPAATALTGYTPEEHYADPELGMKIVDPKDRHVLQMYFEQGGIFDQPIVLRWKRKDGSRLWAEQINWPVVDESGELVAIEGISRDITERKTAEDALIESRHLLRELTQSVMNAQEEERARIAREIHDELAQMLTALRIDLSGIARRIPQEMDDLLTRTKVMDAHINLTVDVVRRISAELRPSVLDNLGLAAAVEWQVDEFRKRTGADTRLRVSPEGLELDEGRSVAVFRILQEALTNVARHADATRADISLTLSKGRLRLRVRDNGKGMATEKLDPTKALGIAGMRERARLWGGDVRIESAKNAGTAVVLEMPSSGKMPDEGGDDAENTHRGRPRGRQAGAKADSRRKTRGREDR